MCVWKRECVCTRVCVRMYACVRACARVCLRARVLCACCKSHKPHQVWCILDVPWGDACILHIGVGVRIGRAGGGVCNTCVRCSSKFKALMFYQLKMRARREWVDRKRFGQDRCWSCVCAGGGRRRKEGGTERVCESETGQTNLSCLSQTARRWFTKSGERMAFDTSCCAAQKLQGKCTCGYICTFMHICVYIYMYIYTCIYLNISVCVPWIHHVAPRRNCCVSVCAYAYTISYIHVCIYVYMYICIFAYTYMYMPIYIYKYVCINVFV